MNPEHLTVVALEVEAFKRLTAAHVTPTATGLVLVRGRNAQGKSSLIESMLDALGSEKADLPITEGEHGGSVKVRLSNGDPAEDLIVEEKLTRDSAGKAKRALSITAANGSKVKGPAGVLKGLRGHFADPVAFLEMKPAEQVKTVLRILEMDVDLEALEAKAEGFYEQRRDLGRDRDRTAKASAEIDHEVAGLPAPPEGPGLEALTEELQAAKDSNAELEGHRQTMVSTSLRGKEAADRLERLKAEVDKLEAEVSSQRDAWKASAEAVKAAGEPIDVSPIVEQITAHEEAGRASGKRELAESARAAHAAADEEWQEASNGLEETRLDIAKLLGSADFPIDGMAYDHEAKALTIGGIPFSQASQAERLKAAAAVAMAGSPSIRVMFAREGSLLDDESRVQLAELAEASKFQLWLEVVDSNPEGAGVWIEDGEASQDGPQG